MDCSPPDSSILGISQARILEWVSFFRVSSQPREWTHISLPTRLDILWGEQLCFLLPLYLECLAQCLEKAMAPHSSALARKIPWTEEPGRLQSLGSQRVGHDWMTSLSLFTFMHWRRKWQSTPVFLPGESQGRRRLVGCRLWGLTESDTTGAT